MESLKTEKCPGIIHNYSWHATHIQQFRFAYRYVTSHHYFYAQTHTHITVVDYNIREFTALGRYIALVSCFMATTMDTRFNLSFV